MKAVTVDRLILNRLTFLEGVDDAESWHALAEELSSVSFRDGDPIFRQGDPADATYFILDGAVRWERRKPRTALGEPILRFRLGAGRLLGHFALLYNHPYPMTATADGPCTLLRMGNHALDRMLYRFPRIRRQMMHVERIGRLRTVPWLAELDLDDISLLAEEVDERTFQAGEKIYQRDDVMPSHFFIIDRGQVQLLHPRDPMDIGYLGNGAVFGIAPMLPGHTRYRNVADALCKSSIYALPRSILDEVARYYPSMAAGDQRQQREAALAGTRLFQRLEPNEIRRLAGYASHYNIPQHHLLTLQNESSDCLWLLMPGYRATLHVLDIKGEALPAKEVVGPIHFGEDALLAEYPISSTIEAHSQSQWLRLNREDFRAFVQAEKGDIMARLLPNPSTKPIQQHASERRRFPWLTAGEVVALGRRRHWLILVQKLIPWLIVTAVLGLMLIGLGFVTPTKTAYWWVTGISAVISLGTFWWGVEDYRNDYLVVTNQRVVQQDKVILINERRRAAPLNQIQNIDVISGFFGNILNYGRMVIHTASKEGDILFDFAPDPETLRAAIFKQRDQRRTGYQAQGKMEIQNILEARLGIKLYMPLRVLVSEGTEQATPTTWWRRLWARIKALWQTQPHNWADQDLIVWHKHWAVLLGKMLAPLSLLIFAAILAVGGFVPVVSNVVAVFGAVETAAVGLALGGFLWMFWVIADWRNDTYEVTSTRIVDVEKSPLALSENRRVAELSEIQDIELDIPSPIHAILRFGNVNIRTAASEGIFSFDNVPDPAGVSEEIRRRMEAWRVANERRQAQNRAKELPDWFEIYKRLDTGG